MTFSVENILYILMTEWSTEDVIQWLESQRVDTFKQGFRGIKVSSILHFNKDASCPKMSFTVELFTVYMWNVIQFLHGFKVCTTYSAFYAPFNELISITLIEQKIDGMCLKEGLSDDEMKSCGVQTIGEKRLLKRKMAELVGRVFKNLKEI